VELGELPCRACLHVIAHSVEDLGQRSMKLGAARVCVRRPGEGRNASLHEDVQGRARYPGGGDAVNEVCATCSSSTITTSPNDSGISHRTGIALDDSHRSLAVEPIRPTTPLLLSNKASVVFIPLPAAAVNITHGTRDAASEVVPN
jgi:hypothetical protein